MKPTAIATLPVLCLTRISSGQEPSGDFYELVVGGDYTFDSQTYLMAEFYRTTRGKTDRHDYDINDWMRLFAAEQKALSRDQLFILARRPVSDLIDTGVSLTYSFSDGSPAVVPTLSWSLTDNADILAYLNVNFGAEGSAFSRETGSGGLLRARVYF